MLENCNARMKACIRAHGAYLNDLFFPHIDIQNTSKNIIFIVYKKDVAATFEIPCIGADSYQLFVKYYRRLYRRPTY